jgi:hypothetical protein
MSRVILIEEVGLYLNERQTMDHTLQVNRPSRQVTTELIGELERQGFHVMQTFNLQLARSHQVDCHCPNHGTEQCTCQYAVLFINDPQQTHKVSRTVTIHGKDDEVWLSLLKNSASQNQANAELERRLLAILLKLANPSSTPVAKEEELVSAKT